MFNLIKIENARMNVPEPEYLEAKAAEAIAEGEALVLSGGVLTKCGATVSPTFIALAAVSDSAEKRTVGVARVESNQVYEVPVSVAPTSLKVGSKVTLAADGLQVTATTTDGVATIVSLNGAAAAGDKILVRF